MKCTDRERNVILGMTHELRWPGNAAPKSEAATEGLARERNNTEGEDGGRGRGKQEMLRRFVGLVVVPGEFITKIEVE